MIRNYDIIIVGGGISSLYFLYKLSKDFQYLTKKIVLLESSNRFGGRIESIATKDIDMKLEQEDLVRNTNYL